MARSPAANRWIYGAAYVGAASVIILLRILPTDLGPNGYPGPDLLLCLTFAWVLRRPHFVPVFLIAPVFLMTDILYLRPPGLWTALVILAAEYLRSRESALRELPLAAELGLVSVVLILVHLANYLVLLIFAVPHGPLGLVVLQTIASLIAYPMIVILARLVFKVDKMSPADVEAARRVR